MATPASQNAGSVEAVARQHVQTSRLLGVDFVPLGGRTAQACPQDEPSLKGDEPARSAAEKAELLLQLQATHDATCPHCTNATGHTRTVFGEGNPDADLMFVGEAPGEEEDRTGRPFVGRAGQKLNDMIRAMGLTREQVYIANVLKARPPNNRTPLDYEVQQCSAFLAQQIRIIQPKVLVALGGPATKMLLRTDVGITRLRGQWAWYEGPHTDNRVPVMPTFHPAYLLRNYTVETRQMVWSDMQAVLAKLNG